MNAITFGTGKLAGIRCYAIEASHRDTDIETFAQELKSEILHFEPKLEIEMTIIGSDVTTTSLLLAKLMRTMLLADLERSMISVNRLLTRKSRFPVTTGY